MSGSFGLALGRCSATVVAVAGIAVPEEFAVPGEQLPSADGRRLRGVGAKHDDPLRVSSEFTDDVAKGS